MRNAKKVFIILLFCAVLCFLSFAGSIAEENSASADIILQAIGSIVEVLESDPKPEALERFANLVDWDVFSSSVFCRKWKGLSQSKRHELTSHMKNLIIQTYIGKALSKKGRRLSCCYINTLEKTRKFPDKECPVQVVKVDIISKGKRTRVSFNVSKKKIIDIGYDGCLLSASMKRQYGLMLSESFDAVLAQLEKKLADIEEKIREAIL